jgi:nicotinamide-nucleotide amidase
LAHHPNVVFGFRTHAPENHLKLLAEGKSPEEAENALQQARAEARSLLAPWLFGEDDETLAGNLGRLLVEGKQTVAVAESCTGGLVSQLLTEPPGATQWFVGGAVTYLESMKEKWANVRHESLLQHTAVSPEVALEMARGIRLETKASIGLSVTGVAGPTGGTPDTPVGTVFCAISREEEDVCERHLLVGDRSRIRLFAAAALLNLLRRNLC